MVPLARSVGDFYQILRIEAEPTVARGGSQHIEFSLKNNLVRTSPSRMLGIAYGAANMDTQLRDLRMLVNDIGSRPSGESLSKVKEEKMLLNGSSAQLIADYLMVPEVAVEIKRAVWQVERSLKAKQEYREEKQEIESATKKPGQ